MPYPTRRCRVSCRPGLGDDLVAGDAEPVRARVSLRALLALRALRPLRPLCPGRADLPPVERLLAVQAVAGGLDDAQLAVLALEARVDRAGGVWDHRLGDACGERRDQQQPRRDCD